MKDVLMETLRGLNAMTFDEFDEFVESKAITNNLKLERGGLFSGLDSWSMCRDDAVVVEFIVDFISEDEEQFLFFSPTKEGLSIAESIVDFLRCKKMNRIKRVSYGDTDLIDPKLLKKIVEFAEQAKQNILFE